MRKTGKLSQIINRIHIVDCLPHVWMLDGRLITAGERLQVKNFFHESALTEHPIATHVMTKFPVNGMHNVETDRRRLKYIAYSLQEDLLIEKKYTHNDYQILRYHKSFMEDILSSRPQDRERCNMLLMLLVASLEFVMPTHLMKDTLETTKLSKVGPKVKLNRMYRDYKCLLASEVVQLLCIVPTFFDYITKDIELGDSLLLGPQTLGKIVSLPQPFVALVAMDSVPAANGAMQSKLKSSEDHYTYVNMDQLLWDHNMHFWKPKGAIGDRLTIHTVEDLQKELERKANMADRQLRPNSPDWQASHGTEPLIYSPRHPTPSSAPPRPKSNQGTPRPMSSLLKEKLDLKLDMSRRTESAAGYLEARQSSENIAKPSSPPTSISGLTDGPGENKNMCSRILLYK
ncbi:unnamed protein product [Mytilus edulis]|uniref:Uncharacterized protein n=1 Tax=Mytilus edulis TaxID=6550 RepID=A0A8S3S2N9_MYTED|nr:unnamed protein product [Mytilus edulis]